MMPGALPTFVTLPRLTIQIPQGSGDAEFRVVLTIAQGAYATGDRTGCPHSGQVAMPLLHERTAGRDVGKPADFYELWPLGLGAASDGWIGGHRRQWRRPHR